MIDFIGFESHYVKLRLFLPSKLEEYTLPWLCDEVKADLTKGKSPNLRYMGAFLQVRGFKLPSDWPSIMSILRRDGRELVNKSSLHSRRMSAALDDISVGRRIATKGKKTPKKTEKIPENMSTQLDAKVTAAASAAGSDVHGQGEDSAGTQQAAVEVLASPRRGGQADVDDINISVGNQQLRPEGDNPATGDNSETATSGETPSCTVAETKSKKRSVSPARPTRQAPKPTPAEQKSEAIAKPSLDVKPSSEAQILDRPQPTPPSSSVMNRSETIMTATTADETDRGSISIAPPPPPEDGDGLPLDEPESPASDGFVHIDAKIAAAAGKAALERSRNQGSLIQTSEAEKDAEKATGVLPQQHTARPQAKGEQPQASSDPTDKALDPTRSKVVSAQTNNTTDSQATSRRGAIKSARSARLARARGSGDTFKIASRFDLEAMGLEEEPTSSSGPEGKLDKVAAVSRLPYRREIGFEMGYQHDMYIYPRSLTVSSHRNLGLIIELCDSDRPGSVGLPCIYGTPGEPLRSYHITPISYHVRRPKFMDEVKIKLPHVITLTHHIRFTLINASVKLLKTRAEKIKPTDKFIKKIGFSFLPLLRGGRPLDSSYRLHVFNSLSDNYILAEAMMRKGKELSRELLAVDARLQSCLYSNDPFVSAFFWNFERMHFEENGQAGLGAPELCRALARTRSRPAGVVRLYRQLFDYTPVLMRNHLYSNYVYKKDTFWYHRWHLVKGSASAQRVFELVYTTDHSGINNDDPRRVGVVRQDLTIVPRRDRKERGVQFELRWDDADEAPIQMSVADEAELDTWTKLLTHAKMSAYEGIDAVKKIAQGDPVELSRFLPAILRLLFRALCHARRRQAQLDIFETILRLFSAIEYSRVQNNKAASAPAAPEPKEKRGNLFERSFSKLRAAANSTPEAPSDDKPREAPRLLNQYARYMFRDYAIEAWSREALGDAPMWTYEALCAAWGAAANAEGPADAETKTVPDDRNIPDGLELKRGVRAGRATGVSGVSDAKRRQHIMHTAGRFSDLLLEIVFKSLVFHAEKAKGRSWEPDAQTDSADEDAQRKSKGPTTTEGDATAKSGTAASKTQSNASFSSETFLGQLPRLVESLAKWSLRAAHTPPARTLTTSLGVFFRDAFDLLDRTYVTRLLAVYIKSLDAEAATSTQSRNAAKYQDNVRHGVEFKCEILNIISGHQDYAGLMAPLQFRGDLAQSLERAAVTKAYVIWPLFSFGNTFILRFFLIFRLGEAWDLWKCSSCIFCAAQSCSYADFLFNN